MYLPLGHCSVLAFSVGNIFPQLKWGYGHHLREATYLRVQIVKICSKWLFLMLIFYNFLFFCSTSVCEGLTFVFLMLVYVVLFHSWKSFFAEHFPQTICTFFSEHLTLCVASNESLHPFGSDSVGHLWGCLFFKFRIARLFSVKF